MKINWKTWEANHHQLQKTSAQMLEIFDHSDIRKSEAALLKHAKHDKFQAPAA